MKCIMELSKDIKTELEAIEHYVEMAAAYKVKNTKLAEMYIELAKGELDDVMTLHKHAVALIEESRKTVTPPEYMLEMWNAEHMQMLERVALAKYKIEIMKS